MEGWFPRASGERRRQRIAMQWDRTQTESPDRATRNDSAAARAEPRAPRLNSRPSSQNGSRRPDRRICGEWGITSCAPTLWKAVQAAFWLEVRVWPLAPGPPAVNGPRPLHPTTQSTGCPRRSSVRALDASRPSVAITWQSRIGGQIAPEFGGLATLLLGRVC
jgi:hypothetical protein